MIRKATDSDREFCSNMYYTSGPNLFGYFFNSNEKVSLRVIQCLYESNDNIFSKKYFYVYNDGVNKGALVLVPGDKLHLLENNVKRCFLSILKIMGLKNIIVSMYRSSLMKKFPEVYGDEYFVYALSVDRKYRGMHIGSKLLKFSEDLGRALKYKKLSLYVEISNDRAIEVYKKNGFEVTSTVNFSDKLKDYNVIGLHKMVKGI